jgi:crossover junction endodeoxyribonuclease RuvC
MRILGIDPGLTHTGWGVIDYDHGRLSFVDAGRLNPSTMDPMPDRLNFIFDGLCALIKRLLPDEAALEITFVNANPASALKLGQARGVAMLAPASLKITVAEYAPNLVKKSVVGAGHADKEQIKAMIRVLLPKADDVSADAADALAVAITHAHHRGMNNKVAACLRV